jgi:isopropylmalate/homocitrate/citramalate synthase
MSDMNYEGVSLENVPFFEKDKYWVSPMNYLAETVDKSQVQSKIEIHDVTLRDGEQTPNVVFTAEERIAMAKGLNDLGVDRIEFGMPVVSQDIYEAFQEVLKMDFTSEIIAFLRAHPDDLKAAVDLGARSVIIEHNVNPYFCKHVYGLTHEETVTRIVDIFKSAHSAGLKARMMGWDASRTTLDYLQRLYTEICEQVVPDSIIFVDTFGVLTPAAMSHAITSFRNWFPETPIEVHNHNGFGLGMANVMAAVLAGASCVHGALLGLGERDGNIPIDEIAMALELLYKIPTSIDLSQISRACELAQRISRYKNQGTKPITGDFYFQLQAGVVIHAVEKIAEAGLGSRTWAAFAPEMIGKSDYQYLLSKVSGVRTIRMYLQELGLEADHEEMQEMLEIVKEHSNLVKGVISLEEFGFMARDYLKKKGRL